MATGAPARRRVLSAAVRPPPLVNRHRRVSGRNGDSDDSDETESRNTDDEMPTEVVPEEDEQQRTLGEDDGVLTLESVTVPDVHPGVSPPLPSDDARQLLQQELQRGAGSIPPGGSISAGGGGAFGRPTSRRFRELCLSQASTKLLSECFWYILVYHFRREVSRRQYRLHVLYDMMSAHYAATFTSLREGEKDLLVRYPDVVAQTLSSAFFLCFPFSRKYFDDAFRRLILADITFWFTGTRLERPEVSHWNSPAQRRMSMHRGSQHHSMRMTSGHQARRTQTSFVTEFEREREAQERRIAAFFSSGPRESTNPAHSPTRRRLDSCDLTTTEFSRIPKDQPQKTLDDVRRDLPLVPLTTNPLPVAATVTSSPASLRHKALHSPSRLRPSSAPPIHSTPMQQTPERQPSGTPASSTKPPLAPGSSQRPRSALRTPSPSVQTPEPSPHRGPVFPSSPDPTAERRTDEWRDRGWDGRPVFFDQPEKLMTKDTGAELSDPSRRFQLETLSPLIKHYLRLTTPHNDRLVQANSFDDTTNPLLVAELDPEADPDEEVRNMYQQSAYTMLRQAEGTEGVTTASYYVAAVVSILTIPATPAAIAGAPLLPPATPMTATASPIRLRPSFSFQSASPSSPPPSASPFAKLQRAVAKAKKEVTLVLPNNAESPPPLQPSSTEVISGTSARSQRRARLDSRREYRMLSTKGRKYPVQSLHWTEEGDDEEKFAAQRARSVAAAEQSAMAVAQQQQQDDIELQAQQLLRKSQQTDFQRTQILLIGEQQRALQENRESAQHRRESGAEEIFERIRQWKRSPMRDGDLEALFQFHEVLQLVETRMYDVPARLRAILWEFTTKYKPYLRKLTGQFKVQHKSRLADALERGDPRVNSLLAVLEDTTAERRPEQLPPPRTNVPSKIEHDASHSMLSLLEKQEKLYRKAADSLVVAKEFEDATDLQGSRLWREQRQLEKSYTAERLAEEKEYQEQRRRHQRLLDLRRQSRLPSCVDAEPETPDAKQDQVLIPPPPKTAKEVESALLEELLADDSVNAPPAQTLAPPGSITPATPSSPLSPSFQPTPSETFQTLSSLAERNTDDKPTLLVTSAEGCSPKPIPDDCASIPEELPPTVRVQRLADRNGLHNTEVGGFEFKGVTVVGDTALWTKSQRCISESADEMLLQLRRRKRQPYGVDVAAKRMLVRTANRAQRTTGNDVSSSSFSLVH